MAVKSAERVAKVLELLATSRLPLTLTEVAQRLDIPRSSAHGILQTLRDSGFVQREERNRYRLGVKCLQLAHAAYEDLDLREIARPVMRELSSEHRVTVNLAVLRSDEIVYIEKIQDNSRPIRLVTHVGATLPAHLTALGKCLVGELPDDEREGWISRHRFDAWTPNSITDPDDFRKEMGRYLERGYAVEYDETHPAIMCIAAPVRDHAAQTVAALSMSMLSSDVDDTVETELGIVIQRAAEEVSAGLGVFQND